MSHGESSRKQRPAALAGAPFAFVPLLTGVLLWAASYDGAPDEAPAPGSVGAIRHLLHHSLGMSPARPARPTVRVEGGGFEPGDILLASRTGGPYGHFTHVTGFIGDERVLAHNVVFGIFTLRATALVHYDHIRVVRPDASREARARAAAFLQTLRGATFNLLAVKRDPELWHCAKSVWEAYRREGLDLAPEREFVLPDDIAASPHVKLLREWGGR